VWNEFNWFGIGSNCGPCKHTNEPLRT